MPEIPNEMENCMIRIAEAMTNMNHNSTIQAEQSVIQTKRINEMADVFRESSSRDKAEHLSILDQLKQQWKLTLALIIIVGGLTGIKLMLP
jgi:hypothetical protein